MKPKFSSNLKIHPHRWDDPKIMKFLWQLGLDVLSTMVFKSRESKFNCKIYGPNTKTAQIWVSRYNINVLEKSD